MTTHGCICRRRETSCRFPDIKSVSDPPQKSFHDLWLRHAGEIHRFAFYMSGDRAAAEEITAETFLRLWLNWDRIEWPTVRSYLFAIARNVYRHELRRSRRESPLDESIPSARSLESDTEAHRELEQVLEWMRELPELDRAALLLRAQGELTYEEIAAVLDIPVSTARVKVHRARLRLAQLRQRSDSPCLFRKT